MRFPSLLLTGTLIVSGSALAVDLKNGQTLHDENCQQCHHSEVYTRDDRRVTSMDALGAQVRRCEQTLELKWFDDQVDDVAGHLNQSYYHFK